MSVPGKNVSQIAFNDKDLSIAVTGLNNYIGRWFLPSSSTDFEYKLISESVSDEEKSFMSLDFVNDGGENT
jgi:hypothetical protein